jgi:DNA-binding transcriptional LysR family regulator
VLLKTRSLSQISQEIEDQSAKDLPSGTLRVACAHFTAMHMIAPVLPELLSRYPQLRVELDVNNHPVSLVGERIDVAIRITDNPEPGMIARRLGSVARYFALRQATWPRGVHRRLWKTWRSITACITASLPGSPGTLSPVKVNR